MIHGLPRCAGSLSHSKNGSRGEGYPYVLPRLNLPGGVSQLEAQTLTTDGRCLL